MDFRKRKLEELIKVKLSELLLRELKDPRLETFVTILGVRLSGDARTARVTVSVIGCEREKRAAIDGLESASGWIQRRLNKELRVRYVPHLIFKLDDLTEERVRLVHKLNESEREELGSDMNGGESGSRDMDSRNDGVPPIDP
jgi:ribosome-binding factor A